MANYKIVFSDLDGTLLNSQGILTPENEQAIKELSRKNILLVPTTGRALSEVPRQVYDNSYIKYFITSNGTYMYDKENDRALSFSMGKEEISFLSSIISDMTVMIGVHQNGKSFYPLFDFENYKYFRMNDYYYTELIKCVTLTDVDMKKYLASQSSVEDLAMFFKYDNELERCTQLLQESGMFNITASVERAIEVTKIGVTKGSGIRCFAENHHIDIEQTIAVGDSKNDIAMLLEAGLSLAVSNSNEELKRNADEIICSNNEHIVRYVLENYINNV